MRVVVVDGCVADGSPPSSVVILLLCGWMELGTGALRRAMKVSLSAEVALRLLQSPGTSTKLDVWKSEIQKKRPKEAEVEQVTQL